MSKGMSKWLLWTAMGLLLMALTVGLLWMAQKNAQEAVNDDVELVYTSAYTSAGAAFSFEAPANIVANPENSDMNSEFAYTRINALSVSLENYERGAGT